jgi:hypothetical protein
MSPAKIAIASIVTIAANAGTGSMKNVTGTSRATAILAVRPGMAPINSPYNDDPMMTKMTNGSVN